MSRQQPTNNRPSDPISVDSISLEVFRHRCSAIAEEMGNALGRTAFSANIKERRDYSCAVFDARGYMIAQAAHIPVHLGAMPRSIEAVLAYSTLEPGDVVIVNDPYAGGSHLPDITMVAPVFYSDLSPSTTAQCIGYVASRAHHADVGGMSPGSMPLSESIYQEGLIIPPIHIQRRGVINSDLIELICRNSRTPDERRGDIAAQRACHVLGEKRIGEMVATHGIATVQTHMHALLTYGERMFRALITRLPDGIYHFEDYLDDDGWGSDPLPIRVTLTIAGDNATVDFTGTAPQSRGPVNAPRAVVESAVAYCFRCLGGTDLPDAAIGAIYAATSPFLHIIIPPASILNPLPPSAVAGGNVETSQRVVDVVFGALAQAIPQQIPAASAGSMNNWTCGGIHPTTQQPFAYYETVGGGQGAHANAPGLDGVQVHMTNTMNTPIESLELLYPLRVWHYGLRELSGGHGKWQGGAGIVREIEFLAAATVSLLTDRRHHAPYGLQGGEAGACGNNVLIHANGHTEILPTKTTFTVMPGDRLRLETPGGGGWGTVEGKGTV